MVTLNALRFGAPTEKPPLIVAHGLFGSARNWSAVGKQLGRRREVIAVDLRNHGASPHVGEHSYPAMAADLAEVIAASGRRADLLGHSMGGKAAMVLALTEPHCVDRLVIADIAPVAYGHTQLQYIDAMRGVDLGSISRRSQADAQLALRIDDPGLRAFFLQSLEIDGERARWRLNLDVLEREMPRIMGFPDHATTFDRPVLFVAGSGSDYLTDAHWPLIQARFPAAERKTISGAGHWVHADAPEAFLAVVETFLDAGR